MSNKLWLLLSLLQYNFLNVWTQVIRGKISVLWPMCFVMPPWDMRNTSILKVLRYFLVNLLISHITHRINFGKPCPQRSHPLSSICSSEYGTHATSTNILLIYSGTRSYHEINAMGHTSKICLVKVRNTD